MNGLFPNENHVINEYTHDTKFEDKFLFRKYDTDSIFFRSTFVKFESKTEGMSFFFLMFIFLKRYL